MENWRQQLLVASKKPTNKHLLILVWIIKEVTDLHYLGLSDKNIRLINENAWWFCVYGNELLSVVHVTEVLY